ncbi:MAG: patatin-like phospholipase family protein, partial [Gemmatimonadaceae bacterium]|nr:patatin-like phospholipase family protein [Gemmatimonadaceae bacterium]
MTRVLVLVLFLCSMAAQTGAAQTARPRPKVALALGGGAAKGFAHIGVIK